VIVLLPGIAGFAVWEFKENWKLYRSNRPLVLKPVMIGHHGETMQRFMKPGFHSGTLPKLYAKLRKAERRDDGRALFKQHEALHHVKESIRHFAEREMLLLLEGSKNWGGLKLHAGALVAATNRVRVELCCPELGDETVWLAFEERAGRLVGEVTRPGWLPLLSPPQREAFASALAGLYKLAGVTLVREQLEACLPAGFHVYRVGGDLLLLWPDADFTREYAYELRPLSGMGLAPQEGRPPLAVERLLFAEVPVAWEDWVAAWSRDQAGHPLALPAVAKVRLLPGPEPVPTQPAVTVEAAS
jgi:hypothetical protein